MTQAQFIQSLPDRFRQHLSAALRDLLQRKHLYQSVVVPRTDSYPVVQGDQTLINETASSVSHFIDNPWVFEAPSLTGPDSNTCQVILPDLKLFCSHCDRIEAYNQVYADDLFRRIQQGGFREKGVTEQAFTLSYRCQSCKGTPEVFLVRRRGVRLTNEGRSPIEHVDVPLSVPKTVRTYMSGAIVAHQSGQTLAGLFLLRTLIEQWSRIASGTKRTLADQIIDDYMETLPDDFKARFPSIRNLYGDLSADIHAATGSSELFNKASGEIAQHFEARRLFEIANP